MPIRNCCDNPDCHFCGGNLIIVEVSDNDNVNMAIEGALSESSTFIESCLCCKQFNTCLDIKKKIKQYCGHLTAWDFQNTTVDTVGDNLDNLILKDQSIWSSPSRNRIIATIQCYWAVLVMLERLGNNNDFAKVIEDINNDIE
jgi:hypothetical protein